MKRSRKFARVRPQVAQTSQNSCPENSIYNRNRGRARDLVNLARAQIDEHDYDDPDSDQSLFSGDVSDCSVYLPSPNKYVNTSSSSSDEEFTLPDALAEQEDLCVAIPLNPPLLGETLPAASASQDLAALLNEPLLGENLPIAPASQGLAVLLNVPLPDETLPAAPASQDLAALLNEPLLGNNLPIASASQGLAVLLNVPLPDETLPAAPASQDLAALLNGPLLGENLPIAPASQGLAVLVNEPLLDETLPVAPTSQDLAVSLNEPLLDESLLVALVSQDLAAPLNPSLLDETLPIAPASQDLAIPLKEPLLDNPLPVAPVSQDLAVPLNELLDNPLPVAPASQDLAVPLLDSASGTTDSLVDLAEQQAQNISKPSPKKRKRSNPAHWNVNIQRQKRLKGESYKTKTGKVIPEKPLKHAKCANNPKHKCASLITETSRETIYNEYHDLKSLHEQRVFLVRHVEKKTKNRSTTSSASRRNYTYKYSFTIDGEKTIVCRDFFLSTLNISEGLVKGALKKVTAMGMVSPDRRGKKIPTNKISSNQDQLIKEHILSFPSMESHYCRKKSETKYLASDLNITIMYGLYKTKMEAIQEKPTCLETYRKIFRRYKLSFHRPKKDVCKHCIAFNEMSADEKVLKGKDHQKHLLRKSQARQCRDSDKESAINDQNTLSFNFDLQSVLSTPKGAAGPFFYVRKLAVYNLTIYNLGNQDIECYVWDETDGKRGSVEISSCIYKYIMSKQNVTQVNMMSDGCGGQQKNFHFCCMCLQILKEHPTLEIINHKFFETGHSQMECDSIHAKIEQKVKNIPIYTTDGWVQVIRLARKNPRPMNVNNFLHDDFLNFGSGQFPAKVNDDNKKIGLTDAVWVQYRKNDRDTIYIATDYDGVFTKLPMKLKRGVVRECTPKPTYTQRINISTAKKNDLLKLCSDLLIPKSYHDFYNNLPTAANVRDSLPEPDADDSD